MTEAHNIDCMEGMAKYPDKYFGLAVIDPPYGINAEQGTNQQVRNRFSDKEYGWDSKPPDEVFFNELFRVSQSQIIWGANHFRFTPSANVIVWDKGKTCRSRAFSDGELAWVSPNVSGFGVSGLRIFDGKQGDVNKFSYGKADRIHPTQKPIKLYEWILLKYAKEGDKILDTHLGSGSSRIAAHNLGFDFVGFELDTEYFEAQEKRFKEVTSQIRMF